MKFRFASVLPALLLAAVSAPQTVFASEARHLDSPVDKEKDDRSAAIAISAPSQTSLRGGEKYANRKLCPGGDPGDGCSFFCPCSGMNTCEAVVQICRRPGKHGDTCHWPTKPCGYGYSCMDALSAWGSEGGYQMCVPDDFSPSESMKEQLYANGHSGPTDIGFDLNWDDGVIPFRLDNRLQSHEAAWFAVVMKELEDEYGVKFVRYDSREHDNYIWLTDRLEPWAKKGKMQTPGWQAVSKGNDDGLTKRALKKTVILPKQTVDGYVSVSTGGCPDRNEGGYYETGTAADCAALCNDDDDCVSFEYQKYGTKCRLSHSCDDLSLTVNNADSGDYWYIKTSAVPSAQPAKGYTAFGTGGCVDRNELGSYDVDTAVKCAAKCNAKEDCVSFEYGKLDTRCALSTSCDRLTRTVNKSNSGTYWYVKRDHVPTATRVGGYIDHDTGGCIGKNELGSFDFPTVEECADICNAKNGCVSFEYQKWGTQCRLSTSCNHESLTVDDPDDINYWYVKTSLVPAAQPADGYVVPLGTGGCPNRNERGTFDVPTAAECATKCDAEVNCVSFEYGKVSTRCAISTSCDRLSRTVENPDDGQYLYIKTDRVLPSAWPSVMLPVEPTSAPTGVPTAGPSVVLSVEPTSTSTGVPTAGPSVVLSVEPTSAPTGVPTAGPSAVLSVEPTSTPTRSPTAGPSAVLSVEPTSSPTGVPSSRISTEPSEEPSKGRSEEPTAPTPCSDATAKFKWKLRNNGKYQKKNCAWVDKKNKCEKETVEGIAVEDLCPVTCGLCTGSISV